MLKTIYETVSEYETIIIHRHMSPDPDALGAQFGLKKLILNNFPFKDVFCVGNVPEALSYIGESDEIDLELYSDALVIVVDTANELRIDDKRYNKGSYLIKIDHHPVDDKYGNYEWVDSNYASTCEMIYEFALATSLKMNEDIRQTLLYGIVADTNRFLYPATSQKTIAIALDMKKNHTDFTTVYDNLYSRNFAELKLFGYIINHFQIEKKVGYVYLDNSLNKKFDLSSASNLIGSFGNINDYLVWVFFIEDKKNKQIRVNIRSRGPVINDIAEKFGGGGHIFASGIRLDLKFAYSSIIEALQERVSEYERKL